MVKRKKWEEFRNTGLVVIINQVLHAFGWAIVFEVENDQIKDVYPARVKFRGFSNDSTDKAYKKIGKYLRDNSEDLYNESNK